MIDRPGSRPRTRSLIRGQAPQVIFAVLEPEENVGGQERGADKKSRKKQAKEPARQPLPGWGVIRGGPARSLEFKQPKTLCHSSLRRLEMNLGQTSMPRARLGHFLNLRLTPEAACGPCGHR